MPRYALVNSDDTILRQEDHAGRPPDLPHKGWRWLPVTVIDPPFDRRSEIRLGPFPTVESNKVTIVWTVRPKTPGELAADRTAAVTALRSVHFAVALHHENRLRALEGRPATTESEFRAVLQGLL